MTRVVPRWWPEWLPQGGSLPERAWQSRHRAVTSLLMAHVVAIPLYAVYRGNSVGHAIVETVPVLAALIAATQVSLGRTGRSTVAALGLMTCSGVIVHLSGGMIEAHFHFFVMIPVVALYEAWMPFALGVGYVLIHHGVMGTLDSRSVYNHPGAWEHPWLFAGVHAILFGSACVACIVNWWLHEQARQAESALVATLAHRAEHDSLTGLPNRAAFLTQRSGDRVEGGRGQSGCTSVLMLDLDNFKEVNDTLGHSFGDHLLEQVSTRLTGVIGPGDLLARLGGDEFAVLLRHTDAPAARSSAEALVAALHEEFLVDGMLLKVDVSIGVATDHSEPGRSCDVEALLRQADVAMYEAKRNRQGTAVYDPGADDHTRERLTLLAELRRALGTDELVLHYQPKVSLTDRSLIGLEALVRWQHPQHGLLAPGVFIPEAEHTALIVPLTRQLIDVALAQIRRWMDDGPVVPVAVNISPRCLLEVDFPARVLESLEREGVPGSCLRLEITESTLLVDPARARTALAILNSAGVGISIDDFGTGYSSMSYLRDLPIDELKIDRSFVAGMLQHRQDAVLVQSAIDLGHNLGLSVVAEGVETTDTLSALSDTGCDAAQGFLMSRPMPADEIVAWLTAVQDAIPA